MLPQITIRDMHNSSFLKQHLEKKILKLNRFCSRINRLHIVIQIPQKHKHQGKLFSVCIELTVPGKEIVNHKLNEDVYVAVRDAFQALQRQLATYLRKRRGEVKTHESTLAGYIPLADDF